MTCVGRLPLVFFLSRVFCGRAGRLADPVDCDTDRRVALLLLLLGQTALLSRVHTVKPH